MLRTVKGHASVYVDDNDNDDDDCLPDGHYTLHTKHKTKNKKYEKVIYNGIRVAAKQSNSHFRR